MSYLEIILLAFGLCADTLAVSMASGASMNRLTLGCHLKIDTTLGIIQALFIALGWALGAAFLSLIESVDHWIAFGLLLFIGGKMIVEALGSKEGEAGADLMRFPTLVLAGVATSIDALAVGVSIAMMGMPMFRILMTFVIVFAATVLVAAVGLEVGKALKKMAGNITGVLAGCILIAIGIKILIEHLPA